MVFWQRMNSVAMPVLMTCGLAGSLMVSCVSHSEPRAVVVVVHGVVPSVHVAGGPTSGTVWPVTHGARRRVVVDELVEDADRRAAAAEARVALERDGAGDQRADRRLHVDAAGAGAQRRGELGDGDVGFDHLRLAPEAQAAQAVGGGADDGEALQLVERRAVRVLPRRAGRRRCCRCRPGTSRIRGSRADLEQAAEVGRRCRSCTRRRRRNHGVRRRCTVPPTHCSPLVHSRRLRTSCRSACWDGCRCRRRCTGRWCTRCRRRRTESRRLERAGRRAAVAVDVLPSSHCSGASGCRCRRRASGSASRWRRRACWWPSRVLVEVRVTVAVGVWSWCVGVLVGSGCAGWPSKRTSAH